MIFDDFQRFPSIFNDFHSFFIEFHRFLVSRSDPGVSGSVGEFRKGLGDSSVAGLGKKRQNNSLTKSIDLGAIIENTWTPYGRLNEKRLAWP